MSHTTIIKVRGYHCDFYGHVNNARFLELLEEARWSYLEDSLDLSEWKEKNLGIVVAALNINYRRPAPVDTVLEIRSTVGEMGAKTGVIHQDVLNQTTGKLVADADVTFAVVDIRTGKAVPMKGEVRAVFDGSAPGDRGVGL
jgi:thioesterase-3